MWQGPRPSLSSRVITSLRFGAWPAGAESSYCRKTTHSKTYNLHCNMYEFPIHAELCGCRSLPTWAHGMQTVDGLASAQLGNWLQPVVRRAAD